MEENGDPGTPAAPAGRILARLRAVYGDDPDPASVAREIASLIDRWKPRIPATPVDRRWTERDALLITYADSLIDESGAPPLQVLHRFLERSVGDRISFVHLLPFFPSTSDYGFSVQDYRAMRPDTGSWNDVDAVARDYRVVFDAVLNHVSSESEYVLGDLAGDPRYAGFCFARKPGLDTTKVVRPRQSPLFHEFERADGTPVDFWTTFSRDQVDLDFRNPAVLLEILDVLLFYASKGASMIRLDAIPYLWKESGTTCIHLPRTHEIVRLVRAVFDAAAPHVILLSETNVPHEENVSYFGGAARDEAQIVYNFSLAPLLIHTLATQDASRLTQWARTLEDFGDRCTFLNITATHDGIGMRPTEGILDESERTALLERARLHGGQVSYKSNPDGTSTPYELNINYFDAINNPNAIQAQATGGPGAPRTVGEPQRVAQENEITQNLITTTDTEARRFLISQAIPMVLPGVPGIYIHSLLGSRSDPRHVVPGETETYRSINRAQLSAADVEAELDRPGSLRALVCGGILHLLETRRSLSAFHPNTPHEILDLSPSLFAVLRQPPPGEGPPLLALFNVTGHPQTLPAENLPLSTPLTDRLTGETLSASTVPFQPYQSRWLT